MYIKTFYKIFTFCCVWSDGNISTETKNYVKKATDMMNTNTKTNLGITKNTNFSQSTSSLNINPIKENKPLVKQRPLARAKTATTFTHPTVSAVKRTATSAVIHGEAKRPLVKSVIKVLASRPNNVLQTHSAANKMSESEAGNKTGTLKKWDLRGRLAQTSEKLTTMQQKHKDILLKHKELQDLVETLKASETKYRTKAEGFEAANNVLTNKLQDLTAEVLTMRKNQEDLTKSLKQSEESCRNQSQMLEENQKIYKAQETLFLKQTEQFAAVKMELVSEKSKTEYLNTTVESLQTLAHNIDQERRLLHNTIQEMKGNIRVFCRVRPRTPKEMEEMKM